MTTGQDRDAVWAQIDANLAKAERNLRITVRLIALAAIILAAGVVLRVAA